MRKSDLIDTIVQGDVSLASTFFIRRFWSKSHIIFENEGSGNDGRTKADLIFQGIDRELLYSKLKRLKISNDDSCEIRVLSHKKFKSGIVIDKLPEFIPTNKLRRVIGKCGLTLTRNVSHYKNIKSAVVYFENSENKVEILNKLRNLQHSDEFFKVSNLDGNDMDSDKEKHIMSPGIRHQTMRLLAEVFGDNLTERLFSNFDNNVAKYKEWQSWHTNPTFKTLHQDLADEETTLKNKTMQILQHFLESRQYISKIDHELKNIQEKYSLLAMDENRIIDEHLEHIIENYAETKNEIMHLLDKVEPNGDKIYQSKEKFVKILHQCYSYELQKCQTAPLNDWLESEHLLILASGQDHMQRMIMKQYEESLKEEQIIALEMKLFDSVINLEPKNLQQTLLETTEYPWLDYNLRNHFTKLLSEFNVLEDENVKLKKDWQNWNSNTKIKVNVAEQKRLYDELKFLKNQYKYLKMSNFASPNDWNKGKIESKMKLSEIHSEVSKRIDGELLKLRHQCKNDTEAKALHVWNVSVENVFK